MGQMRKPEYIDVDGRKLSERISEKYSDKLSTGFTASGYGPVTGCCEHGNEPSGSIEGGEFLD
jgi:hypothetical protein